jgi:ankyrin repeat protein
VQMLASACPDACAVQDHDGRTPLHLACDRSCQLFEGDCYKASDPPSINVVFTLAKTHLASVSLEDNDGASALELAILSNASIEVVRLLQAATSASAQQQNHIVDRPLRHAQHAASLLDKKKSTENELYSIEKNFVDTNGSYVR